MLPFAVKKSSCFMFTSIVAIYFSQHMHSISNGWAESLGNYFFMKCF